MKKISRGFTLIEILIVVAIIAILASAVVLSIAPAQQAGRDSRRLSDLREVQNSLQLYYNQCGFYPSSAGCDSSADPGSWDNGSGTSGLQGALSAFLGNSQWPVDPSANRSYAYSPLSSHTSYVIAADLENAQDSVFTSYTPPNASGTTFVFQANAGGSTLEPSTNCEAPTYCISN